MAKVVQSMRDLLSEDQRGQAAVDRMQATLRANMHPEPHPDESRYVAQVPGDDNKAHPLYLRPNPYMKHGFMKLKNLWDKGLIPEDKIPEVRRAMLMLADGQAWGEKEPYCIAKDQTEVLIYQGNFKGDEDIWDPSAVQGASPKAFTSTIQHSDD